MYSQGGSVPGISATTSEPSFFFATPRHLLVAESMFTQLSGQCSFSDLPAQVRSLQSMAEQAGRINPVVIGAIPFDQRNPVRLGVPDQLHMSGQIYPQSQSSATEAAATASVRQVPAPDTYKSNVRSALDKFATGELDKVVLSRSLEIELPHSADVRQLLHRLASRNPTGYTFGLDVARSSQRQILIGASPELLVSRQGNKVVANPLAGSAARSDDPAEDRRRAEALLVSEKDLHEHALVVKEVAAALAPFCTSLQVPEQPSLIQTETMWHLSTVVEGDLDNTDTTSLELALALHPTPAVCGFPRDRAQKLINQLEGFNRGFFTGLIGWCDSQGDGEWVVTIRCAEVQEKVIRLYAGAGVVAGSSPESELAETGAKFRTMLDAIGVSRELEVA